MGDGISSDDRIIREGERTRRGARLRTGIERDQQVGNCPFPRRPGGASRSGRTRGRNRLSATTSKKIEGLSGICLITGVHFYKFKYTL